MAFVVPGRLLRLSLPALAQRGPEAGSARRTLNFPLDRRRPHNVFHASRNHASPSRITHRQSPITNRPNMKTNSDKRIVMTLDAGGTNFRFSAIRGTKAGDAKPSPCPPTATTWTLPGQHRRGLYAASRQQCPQPPVAISFAFPGPADYPNGIIGDLGNLPGFRGGVALGPMLRGEVRHPGLHQQRRRPVRLWRSHRRLSALRQRPAGKGGQPEALQEPLRRDARDRLRRRHRARTANCSSATTRWRAKSGCCATSWHPQMNAEEGASIRAVRRVYAEKAGIPFEQAPEPKDIFDIGTGAKARQPGGGRRSLPPTWAKWSATPWPTR